VLPLLISYCTDSRPLWQDVATVISSSTSSADATNSTTFPDSNISRKVLYLVSIASDPSGVLKKCFDIMARICRQEELKSMQ
jgi:hypothetical protein